MTLEAGARLGIYEVVSSLGAGGMGEVYRAKDPSLGREVAIKVLPEEVAQDPERLARFEREARALAALNHPNIATIHGFEKDTGTAFLVMEIIEGDTLADRIARGPISVEEALPMFLQIAEGLEAAHESGIIHRDLKPANIKVSEDGHVKILDFGLAKAVLDEASSRDVAVSRSPTLTLAATQRGEILGTAAYMSPEQAKGAVVDKRTDIWAFGVCLFEALAGARAFKGNDTSELLGSVLMLDPSWEALPAPAVVRRLLERCLVKDPKQRLHDIADVRLELEAIQAMEPEELRDARAESRASSGGWRLAGLTAALGLVVGAALSSWVFRSDSAPASDESLAVQRFTLASEEGADLGAAAQVISPDGLRVAYTGPGGLSIRELEQLTPRLIPETEGAAVPFWSPAGDWLGYRLGQALWKVRTRGGEAVKICDLPFGDLMTASWGEDGAIVFVTVVGGWTGSVMEVSAAGGVPSTLYAPDREAGEMQFQSASHLPDGRGLLLSVFSVDSSFDIQVRTTDGERKTVMAGLRAPFQELKPVYSETGHLLYTHRETPPELWAVPFSLEDLEVAGDSVRLSRDATNPSVSSSGTLVYGTKEPDPDQLLWVSRSGEVLERLGSPFVGGSIGQVDLSPDGGQIVFIGFGETSDLYVQDIQRGSRRQLTQGEDLEHAAWTPSGDRILFVDIAGDHDIWSMSPDGSGDRQAVVVGPGVQGSADWSQDGGSLVFYRLDEQTSRDLWYLRSGDGEEPVRWVDSQYDEALPRFSPDGRYVAYQANDQGRWEIYVESFPERTRRWAISERGGEQPRWSLKGDELFFVEEDRLMSAKVTLEPEFSSQAPVELFRGADVGANLSPLGTDFTYNYDVAPEADRFVVIEGLQRGRRDVVLVRNWTRDLEQP